MVKIETTIYIKPKGLINTGNNCFINSTLQCIIHHPNVFAYFYNTNFEKKEKYSLAFQEFLKTYIIENNKISESPNKLIKKLKEKINILDGEMQDANEFLILLIDLLINERIKEPKIITEKFLINFNENKILKLFSGLKKLNFKCLICNKEKNRFELFRFLYVNGNSVQTSVKKYFTLMDEQTFTCTDCNKASLKFKKTNILFMPELLTVVVNRFLSVTEKNNIDVQVQMKLKVHDFNYRLFGIVCHKGTLISGHYICYVYLKGEWLLFDDESVKKSEPKLISPTVYFAFYTRTIF
ncbi:Ubiquitin carboxyl-terminal hydrolase 16 [Cucumispora dikerogammari]|nr:Ubiquitin carboxyl-terminal hydrolase 16 [Cucumispora dikerogammari]